MWSVGFAYETNRCDHELWVHAIFWDLSRQHLIIAIVRECIQTKKAFVSWIRIEEGIRKMGKYNDHLSSRRQYPGTLIN
jgi:hypothetical protein